jgi:hypothetical protein
LIQDTVLQNLKSLDYSSILCTVAQFLFDELMVFFHKIKQTAFRYVSNIAAVEKVALVTRSGVILEVWLLKDL